MSLHRFPFSSCALRSLALEAEQLERWEIRKKVKSRPLRSLQQREGVPRTPRRPSLLCTDPIVHQAIFSGDLEALKSFIGGRCPADLLIPNRSHELRWSSQRTGIWSLTYEEEFTCPLYVTATRGYAECLQLLLREGADVEFAPGGESALHGACENAQPECAEILLRYGANPNSRSEEGTFPLHLCTTHQSYPCSKLLLQYGAHVNSQSEDEEGTPLHVAARHGMWEHVDLYLGYGAAVNKKNVNGETPLCAACGQPQSPQELEQYFQVCQRLIESGADIHVGDRDQQTPLHVACKSANPQVVELLLEHGAEVNIMSYSGNTAMHNILQTIAYKLQHQPEIIVRALLNHGAIRVWPGALIKVLRYCYSSPRTVEALLNTYSRVRVTEEWAEVVPKEEQQKHSRFFESVFSLSERPRSLQHLCRCALRSYLEGRLPQTLPNLPLPPPLCQFLQLRFEDVLY